MMTNKIKREYTKVNGQCFEMVDRKAKIGEKIIIVSNDMWHGFKVGTVAEMGGKGAIDGYYVEEKDGSNRDYLVLQPVTVAESQDGLEVLELLANLARRVNSLETQLRDTQRNIETFAQQTEHNSEDIRNLNDRTQVIGAINSYYGGAR